MNSEKNPASITTPKGAQPANFASSKADILQTLQYYFGDPAYPQKIQDYTEHHAATYHFPDAYVGQNVKLRETLSNLITENQQNWMTTVILPWKRQDNPNVVWDSVHFDVRLLQRVPYEGVSRLQTSLRRQHRDRTVRRGIGMILESDFYTTPMGKKQFADNLMSIQMSVQETANFDGLFALLTCPREDHMYDLDKGLVPRRTIIGAMRRDLELFAITQKDGRGLDRVIEAAKERMGRYHVTPNSMIIAPQMSLYIAMGPEERINYSIGGPQAIANYEAGPRGFESRTFRGLRVFVVNPFDVGDAKESVQMLSRHCQNGEYYPMSMPTLYDPNKPLSGDSADIVIYDEDRDSLVRITIERALRHCLMSDVFNSIHRKKATPNTPLDSAELDFLGFRRIYSRASPHLSDNAYERTMRSLMNTVPDPQAYGFDKDDKISVIVALIIKNPELWWVAQPTTAAAGGSATSIGFFDDATEIARARASAEREIVEDPTGLGAGFSYHKSKGTCYKGDVPYLPFSLCPSADGEARFAKGGDWGEDKARDTHPDFLEYWKGANVTESVTRQRDAAKRFINWLRHFLYCKLAEVEGGTGRVNIAEKNCDRLAAAIRAGIWIPLEIVLCRPFIEHRMLSAILTVAGSDTGDSLFGLADMQLSANTSTKVIEGHYTCHTKSVISNSRNVLIQENIFSHGYVAGCNTVFFGEQTPDRVWAYKSKEDSKYVTDSAVRQAISNRLAFSLDYSEARQDVYESMLAFIVPHGSTAQLPEQAFNITKRFLPWEVSASWPERKQFPGKGLIWEAYNEVLQLDSQILAGEDLGSRQERGFINGGTNNNSVCFIGPHRVYNYLTGNFSHLVPGQGHWGPDALPGDARWRRGETVSMKDAREALRYGDLTNEKSLIYTS